MRKGCEGTIASQEIDRNKKEYLEYYQKNAMDMKEDGIRDFHIRMQTVAEIKYNIEKPQELIKWFLDQVKRYLFFKECTDLKKLFEEKLGINPQFAEKIQKGRFNFSPLRIQLRFPSAKTKFSMPKWRDPFLIARGEDGLVRIWKRDKKHNYLLLNEIGEKGAGSGAFDLCSEDYLFYSYGKGVKVYFWRNSALVKDIKFEMPVNDISSEKHSVRIMFDSNQAQKMEIKNGEPVFFNICKPINLPENFLFFESLLKANALEMDGTIYFVPEKKIDKKIKLSFKSEGLSKPIISLFEKFYNHAKKDKTFVKNKDLTVKDLIIYKMIKGTSNLDKIIIKNLVPVSLNPEVEISGLERFDDYLVFGFNKHKIRIYNRKGEEKLCFQLINIHPDEFRKPEKDVELRVFEDGFLLMKGNDSVYGSKNRYDYIYVTDGYNVYFPDMEEYKEYFDYIEYEPLFDEILKGSWKKKEKKSINKKSENSVNLVLPESNIKSQNISEFILRDKPLKQNAGPGNFKSVFNLTNDRRPLNYISNQYKDNGDGTISDLATGLVWQKDGSGILLFSRVPKYVKEINEIKPGGLKKWRLPSIDELMSLLEPEKQANGLYIKDIFHSIQQNCWSCDLRSGTGVWVVNFNTGLIGWARAKSSLYVRLVCSRNN